LPPGRDGGKGLPPYNRFKSIILDKLIAFEQNGTLFWFYIGTHDGYEAQINR
jgi:hypothetical protein